MEKLYHKISEKKQKFFQAILEQNICCVQL